MASACWLDGNESVQMGPKMVRAGFGGLTIFESGSASGFDRKTHDDLLFSSSSSVRRGDADSASGSVSAGRCRSARSRGGQHLRVAERVPLPAVGGRQLRADLPGRGAAHPLARAVQLRHRRGGRRLYQLVAWPLPGDPTPPQVEIDIGNGPHQAHEYEMHELGHVFDATEMQDSFRAEFMAIWGLSGGASAWWTQFGRDHGSAGEWFAESYRVCALYGPQMPYQAWKADSPSYGFVGDRDWGKQDASCRLILHVGAAEGPPLAGQPDGVRAARARPGDPQSGRMPWHRPAAARRASALREAGRRLLQPGRGPCRAPDPGHGQGRARPLLA